MRYLFLLCLIALAAAAGLVILIEQDPGYMLIAWGSYTVEMTVWIALATIVAILLVIWLIVSLLRRTFAMGRAVQTVVVQQSEKRAQQQTARGLIAFIEGNWERSRELLLTSSDKSETPLLNYLIAARASHQLGDLGQRGEYLKHAAESTSGASIAVDITQAELQLHAGQLEECLATLKRARKNAGKHPRVLGLLKDVYTRLDDWEQILALIPELRRHNLLPDAELAALHLQAAIGNLDNVADRNRNSDALSASLHHWWQQYSKEITRNSEAVVHYARHLVVAGDDTEAEKLVRNQLKREWHADLVLLYGRIAGRDPAKQLLTAEGWLKEHTNDAPLLLTLGRLSLRNELWTKAREYFENCYRLDSSAEVCAELGRLLAHQGELDRSNAYFQESLANNSRALPTLPMPKTDPAEALRQG